MQKPRLSFRQILNMSFGFLGIQMGFALQNANASRIFETLGAKVDQIPILWIAAPLTGLLVQPIIGYCSDKTWNRLGRRRPYFLFGAIFATLALFIMPNSPALWVAAGMLWIMDASINISMEPFRAFVGDMLPEDQRNIGFSMQSFFIGTGSVIASALPYMLSEWFKISNVAPDGGIPDTVKFSFYIGGTAFLAAVLVTVFTTKEYSPEQIAAFEVEEKKDKPIINKEENKTLFTAPKLTKKGLIWSAVGIIACLIVFYYKLEKELYVVGGSFLFFGIVHFVASLLIHNKKQNHGIVEVISDMYTMPKTMQQLAVVQFFTWFALFSLWIYTTRSVAQNVFGTTDTSTENYNNAANWVGILFAVYNLVAALFAFLLPKLARHIGRKYTHALCLAFGGIGFISIFFITDQYMLLLSMVCIGIAWASILSMPYAMLTGSLPAHKMGVYMGIFNYFIVIPQILAASILGFLVSHYFNEDAIKALVLGGFTLFIAAVSVLFVDDISSTKN